MKKNLRISIIVILLFTLLIPRTYSYDLSLIEPEVEEKQFFEISKTEFTKNEKVEMIINLDSIKYNEFTFELKSDEVIENLEIAQSDEVETEKNNNEIVMEINKAKTNVQTINLFYSIPENKEVGDTIKFIATITGIIENEKEEMGEEQIEVPIEKEETNKEEIKEEESEQPAEKEEVGEEETQSIEIEIKIIEEKKDDKPEDNKPETQIPSTDNNKPETQMPSTDNNKPETQKPNTENNKQEIDNSQIPNQNNVSTTVQKIPTNNSNIQYNTMSNITISNNQVPKVTYNGSDNNYLNELTVEGYTFNRAFSKENTTYFITVEKEIEKLNISAIVDDDEATVTIYGNEALKEGTNKILIAVTAENGNVRNYRIYVTKNS